MLLLMEYSAFTFMNLLATSAALSVMVRRSVIRRSEALTDVWFVEQPP